MQRLLTIPDVTSRGASAALTPRDRELLGHLTEGRSTAQIALAMAITSNTVRTRIRRVTRKIVPSS